ncbi:uncharacterized protein TNCV_5029041 [Trichonephila clavipes]|nr:uncharacterized protein TNCV_5029041 [Trichonephila clavipes]
MSEESLVDHIFIRLELQVQDYDVEVRNPKTMAQLLEVMAKFEERYSCKEMQGSSSNENLGRRDWDVRLMSNDDDGRRRNWRDAKKESQERGSNNTRTRYNLRSRRTERVESRPSSKKITDQRDQSGPEEE